MTDDRSRSTQYLKPDICLIVPNALYRLYGDMGNTQWKNQPRALARGTEMGDAVRFMDAQWAMRFVS